MEVHAEEEAGLYEPGEVYVSEGEYEDSEGSDEGKGEEEDSEEQEYNMRMYGIHAALPVPEGDSDWEEGER